MSGLTEHHPMKT